MSLRDQKNKNDRLEIIYDGECPFCTSYVKMIRLKDAVGSVELISAREDHPIVRSLLAEGYDLDNGMAAIYNGNVYYGSEAVNFLSVISTQSGLFNRLMKVMFKRKWAADAAYPFLRFGRNSALFLKGTKQLKEHYKDKGMDN